MSWLVGAALASLAAAFLVVRIFDHIVSGVRDTVAGTAARAGLFVGTWTAVTTATGMRDFAKRIRNLRQGNRGIGRRINALRKDKGG